jgi:predicted esterase
MRTSAKLSFLVSTVVTVACGPTHPPEAPPSAPPEASAAASSGSTDAATEGTTPPVPPVACPPALALAAPSRGLTGRSPQLVDHAGELAGPLPWVGSEAADAGPRAPLLVLLPGRGDSPERFLHLGHELAARLDGPVRLVAVRAPQPLGVSGGRQWFGREVRPGEVAEPPAVALRARVAELSELLGKLRARYPEAPPPVVIGFSQGAMVALHLAAAVGTGAAAGQLSGVVALSGAFAAEIAPAVTPAAAPAAKLPPVLVVAGSRDAIVPAAGAWEATAWFASHGHPVTCHAFDGTHRVTPAVLDAVAGWLHPLLSALK